jgi:hypothetical protein
MTSTPFECKYQIVLATPLVFVDVGEHSVVVNDVITFFNSLVALVKEEELEETLLDVNVS